MALPLVYNFVSGGCGGNVFYEGPRGGAVALSAGIPDPADAAPVCFDTRMHHELQHLAAAVMRRERAGHTLQRTALVHELYLKLFKQQKDAEPLSKAEFFGLAARMMRQILVDHARKHRAAKRGSGGVKIALDEVAVLSKENSADLLILDEALNKLNAVSPRKARVVELRFFLDMPYDEIATQLNIAIPTAKIDWKYAQAFLRREMTSKCRTASASV